MTNSVNVSKSGVLYSGISDHSLVYVIRKFKRPKSEPKLIKTRSFKNFVEDNFLRDLRNADWTYFLNFSDLDRACKVFNDIVKTVAEKHAPYVTNKIKGPFVSYIRRFITFLSRVSTPIGSRQFQTFSDAFF